MPKKLFVLPGFSPKNEEWTNEIVSYFESEYDVVVQKWKHWQTGNGDDFNLEGEVKNFLRGLAEEKAHIYIIAKSIGTWVFAHALKPSPKLSGKVVLCGIPLNDLEESEKDVYKVLSEIEAQTVTFQDENDSHGSSKQIKNYFRDLGLKISVIEKGGDTHNYSYYSDFKDFFVK